MKVRSLRLGLLAGAALWIALALAIAGVVIGALFVAVVEQDQRARLGATFARVVALIEPGASPPALSLPLADPRYDTPYSGLYWQIELPDGVAGRSRSLWDFVIPTASLPQSPQPRFATLPGPAGQNLLALLRDLTIGGESGPLPLRVTVAESRAALDDAITRFGSALWIALAVLAVALIGAAWLQVQLGLRPLQRLRRGVEAVRRGEAQRLGDDYPSEVLPLTAEVNELLTAQETSIAFARARAADLAHGLKTPLAVLSTMADDLEERADTTTAGHLRHLVDETTDRINYQLRLSGLRLRTGAQRLSAGLSDACRRTIAVLEKTRDGERLQWRVDLEDPLRVDIDEHDLIELVGVLLENAAKWAKSQVVVTARPDGASALLEVADDGPGLTETQIARLGERGKPLDESGHGTGFGLSIAREVVALNNGSLAFGRAETGGLRVTLRLPLAARYAREG